MGLFDWQQFWNNHSNLKDCPYNLACHFHKGSGLVRKNNRPNQ